MRKKSGFTLTELLVTLVILGIVIAIAIPAVGSLQAKFKKEYYLKLDDTVTEVGKTYYKDNAESRPVNLLESKKVSNETLMTNKYIDNISVYRSSTSCTGNVVIMKINNNYIYKNCMECKKDGKVEYPEVSYKKKLGQNNKDNLCFFSDNDKIIYEYDDINNNNEIYVHINNYTNEQMKREICFARTAIRYPNGGNKTKYLYKLKDDSTETMRCPLNISSIDLRKENNYTVEYANTEGTNEKIIHVYQHPEVVVKNPTTELSKNDDIFISNGINLSINRPYFEEDKYNSKFEKYQYEAGSGWTDIKCKNTPSESNNYFCEVDTSKITTETVSDSTIKFRVVGKSEKQSGVLQYGKTTGPYSIKVKITFNGNGGTPATTEKEYKYNDNITGIPTVTRTGYNFDGWYTATSGGSKVGTKVTTLKNITLYAHWKNTVYKITYNLGGGSQATTGVPGSYTYGTGATINGRPTKSNNTFNGWSTSSNLTNPSFTQTIGKTETGDKSYYAKWCNNCNSVSNGRCSLTATEAGVCAYDTSCNDGYTISNNGKYNATCTANTYKIKYNKNATEAKGTMADSSCTYGESCTLRANAYTRSNYTFSGWAKSTTAAVSYSNKQSVKNLTTEKDETVNLYAKWCNNCESISNGSCSLTVTTSGVCTYATSCNTGYTISNNGKYNATCTANKYTIAYNLDGGTYGKNHPTTANYDQIITINNPTRDGYTFAGWTITGMDSVTHAYGNSTTTKTSLSGVKVISYKNLRATAGTVTFKATWTQNVLIVKYKANDATLTATTTSAGGSTLKWTKDSNNIISLSKNNGTATNQLQTAKYGEKIDLLNYNNHTWLELKRTGYSAKNAEEWTCSGCKSSAYNHDATYNVSDICDIKNTSCTVTMSVNWVANTYIITLDKQSGSSGTGSIYEKYNTAIYLDSAQTKAMTTSANAITKPSRSYKVTYNMNGTGITKPSDSTSTYTFGGYYTETAGKGTQMINASGYRTSDFTLTKYSKNTTLYAKWTSKDIALATLTKTGYACKWNTKSDGSGTSYTGEAKYNATSNVTLYAVCTPYKVIVKYMLDAGTLTPTTKSSGGTTYKWTTNSNTKIISLSTNGATATDELQKYSYGESINLLDYNNAKYLNITRTGYSAKNSEEWLCHSGCKTANQVYSQSENFNVNNLCEAKTGNCTVVLKVNWTVNSSATPTISGGTTKIYGSWDNELTCTSNTTYDIGTTKYYSFGYSTTNGGTPSNWTSDSTSNKLKISKEAYIGIRYYSCRVYAKNGSLKSSTVTSSAANDAQMTINNATITFNANGGTINGTTPLYAKMGVGSLYTQIRGTTTGTVPSASKTGYSLSGWYTATSGGSKVLNANGTLTGTAVSGYSDASKKWVTVENKTLYAQWTANTYTVTLDKQSGSGGTSTIYEKYNTGWYSNSGATTSITSITKPTRTGYTFGGYYTETGGKGTQIINASGTINSGKTTTFSANGTLYAKWSANTFTVAYNGNGATSGSVTSHNCSYDAACTLKSNGFVRDGYTFAGWKKSNSGSMLSVSSSIKNAATSGTVTYYAQWNTNYLTIKYKANNATLTPTTTSGTTTLRWTKDSNNIISLSKNGATATNELQTAKYGEKIDLLNYNNHAWLELKRTGYIGKPAEEWACTGCKKSVYNHDATHNVSDICDIKSSSCTVTMSVNWVVGTYTVTLDKQSGSGGTSTIYEKYNTGWYSNSGATTSITTITVPTRTGYTFGGYYTAANGGGTQIINASGTINSGKTTTFTANGTLYAKWTANTYTVTLNQQSGSGGTTTIYEKYNTGWYSNSGATTSITTITKPTRPGYTFGGYYTETGGKGTQIINASGTINSGKTTTFTANATLYAKWTANTYTVEYYQGNNSSTAGVKKLTSSTHTYATAKELTAYGGTAPSGWAFYGWSTTQDGTSRTYTNKQSVSNLTTTANGTVKLYAVFSRTINVYSGTNKAKNNSKTQYYNPYKTDKLTSISLAVPQAITSWTALGYRANTTASAAAISVTTQAVNTTPAYNATTSYYAVYSRSYTATFYSGTNKSMSRKKTISTYYNTNTATVPTTVSITLDTEANAAAISNWTKLGWRNDTTSGSKEYNYGATATVAFGTNFYSVYSRSYTATFYSGTNKSTSKTKSSSTEYYNTNASSLPTTVSITLDTSANATTISNWEKLGWRNDTTTGTKEYDYGATATVAFGTNFYSVYSRNYTANFYSGTNKSTSKTKTSSTVYYNTNTASVPTTVSITLDTSANAATISNWEKLGWRNDTTTGTKEYDYGATATVSFGTNFYSVYSRSYTANFYSGASRERRYLKTVTSYYNTNTSTVPTNISITLHTVDDVKSISNWTMLGWRDDTTAGAKEYNYGGTVTVPFGTDFYSVYSRTLTVSYAGNGNASGSTSSTTKTVYLNSNSTTTSSKEITLASNGFAKTGYTFSKWNVGNAGTKYTPSVAYNAGTFGATATAQWKANTYNVTLNGNGATSSGSGSATATYYSTTLSKITLPKRQYTVSFNMNSSSATAATAAKTATYTFNGWYTATRGGSKVANSSDTPALQASISGYTDASKRWTKTSAATLYAQWSSQSVTLPKISRTNYICKWNTKSDGSGTNYNGESNYTPTANTTLYAYCTRTLTVTFNYNKASWNANTFEYCPLINSATSCSVTAPSIPNLTGTNSRSESTTESISKKGNQNYSSLLSVKGWNTDKNATTATKAVGSSISVNSNTTYYAIVVLNKTSLTAFPNSDLGLYCRNNAGAAYAIANFSGMILTNGSETASFTANNSLAWVYSSGTYPLWIKGNGSPCGNDGNEHFSSPNCTDRWVPAEWLSW